MCSASEVFSIISNCGASLPVSTSAEHPIFLVNCDISSIRLSFSFFGCSREKDESLVVSSVSDPASLLSLPGLEV